MDRMTPAGATVEELLAHGGWLRALAGRLARDASGADDLVQQTWLRALEAPPRERAAGAAWLATVIRNLARDAGRRDVRRSAREASVARGEATESASTLVARAEAQRRLLDAVMALPAPQRDVVLLRFFEELPPREIARRAGVPAATVRTRLHRALAELRARLGGPGASPLAVLAVALPPFSSSPSAPWIGGALVAKKKAALLALALCGMGGAAWFAADGLVAAAPDDPPPAAAPDAPAPADRPRAAQPDERAAAETPAAPDAPAAPAEDPPPAATVVVAPKPAPLAVTFLQYLPERAPPPGIREIKEGEKVVIGEEGTPDLEVGGGAGMRPIGWSRWHPIPPKGKVTYRGRVVDGDGKPVPGAEVFRVELDDHGGRASPSSFQWITDLGTTAADGTFEAKDQPDGAFLVAADWHARLRRPRGLDLAASKRVEATGTATVSGIDLVFPEPVSRFGGVRGVVRDPDGAPVGSARVWCGMESMWTKADGRFELLGLEPGDRRVHADGTGFAERKDVVAIAAGQVVEGDIVLQLAVSGALEISGTVADEEGRPVASVPLFLSDGSMDGARWTKSDAEGRFRFTHLPDAWSKKTVDVMVSPHPEHDAVLAAVKKGVRVPETGLAFVVRRLADVVVSVRGADGKPVSLFNLDVRGERPGEKPRQLHSMSAYEEDGRATIRVPAGRVVIGIEGKGHRRMEVAIDVPSAPGPFAVTIDMQRE